MSAATVAAADLAAMGRRVYAVDLSGVSEIYAETTFKVRDLGIAFSDRRAVKALKLLAASALLCGRTKAMPADLWVLRYVWDREEQIDPLAAMINGILKQHQNEPATHPLAAAPERVDGEDLARQLDAVALELQNGQQSLVALARFRERLTGLSDQAAWIGDEYARKHLLERAGELLKRLG
jgi:MoxR-like ATPase